MSLERPPPVNTTKFISARLTQIPYMSVPPNFSSDNAPGKVHLPPIKSAPENQSFLPSSEELTDPSELVFLGRRTPIPDRRSMGVFMYLDTVLVPLSLFLTVGYHAYLWRSVKTRPSTTTIGADALKRNSWFLALDAGDDKKSMLAVQSLRNTLMVTILTATISILVYLALAALINNAFNASDLFSAPFFGSASSKIVALKYGSASLFLAGSFLCSSLAVGFLVDANYLINASCPSCSGPDSLAVFERGFVLALFGNRLLCLTFPTLMWMLGPIPVALSSSALVWVLYELDFTRRPGGIAKRSLNT